jgi:hypothetical protein
MAQASASAASVPGRPGSLSSRRTISCTWSFFALPSPTDRLLHLERGVFENRKPREHAAQIAAPRACPRSSVDCGFTFTNTFSTAAFGRMVALDHLREAVEDGREALGEASPARSSGCGRSPRTRERFRIFSTTP